MPHTVARFGTTKRRRGNTAQRSTYTPMLPRISPARRLLQTMRYGWTHSFHREASCVLRLSQSHGAKGPEIEPRQKLLPAGSWHHVSCRCEARHIRQWSFAALVTLMGGRVCVCVACVACRLAAVCARYSDVSEMWASSGCKYLSMPVCPRQCHFGCVLVGIARCMSERQGWGWMSWRACAHCHRMSLSRTVTVPRCKRS